MPHNRFYIDTLFQLKTEVSIKHEARHLKVMRLQENDTIELVNGRGQLAKATLKRNFTATIFSIEMQDPPFPIILCQAIPRLNRLDTIVEKTTELGVSELWLFPGTLSEKKGLSTPQLNRLRQITIAAMKQCGRLHLPKIKMVPSLIQWQDLPHPAYFGDLCLNAPHISQALEKKTKICFLIGPEAGFSAEEEKQMRKLGAQGIKLHPWILRTDTAPLVALSYASYYLD